MSELNRFHEAQEEGYPRALSEIKNGMKVSHWMWYIFPQITGLGYSSTAQYYAIKDLEEALEYLNDEVLGNRLREISSELLKLETNIPVMVFGMVDSLKLNSSMTLFDYISEDSDNVFSKVIDKYYDGVKDQKTIDICNDMKEKVLKK